MTPGWLTAVAWLYLSVCFACAAIIAADIALGRRQSMGVMNVVYPVTALYFGPAALALYWRWGRAARLAAASQPMSMSMAGAGAPVAAVAEPDRHGRDHEDGERARPGWVTMAIEVSHCGAGCSLGDVISEFAVFWLGLSVAGLAIGAEYVGDYVLALALGILFQYFAIAPMRGLGVRDGLVAAAKADFISLTAFEIGLFGWMAVMTFVLFPAPNELMPSSAAFWLLMQVGTMIGFATSWPANAWLVRRGIKIPM